MLLQDSDKDTKSSVIHKSVTQTGTLPKRQKKEKGYHNKLRYPFQRTHEIITRKNHFMKLTEGLPPSRPPSQLSFGIKIC